MGQSKIKFSERKYKGRKKHSAKVCAGNGEPLIASSPKQPYYNKPELESALLTSGKAIVFHYREEVHVELMPIFEAFCKENNLVEGSLDSMHTAMDLMFKHFKEA